MQQQADEDELGLSSAALAALKEFALENDMLGEVVTASTRPILYSVRSRFIAALWPSILHERSPGYVRRVDCCCRLA